MVNYNIETLQATNRQLTLKVHQVEVAQTN